MVEFLFGTVWRNRIPRGEAHVSTRGVRPSPRAKDSGGMVCCCLLPSCRFCGGAPVSLQGHRKQGAAVVSRVGEAPAVAFICLCCMPGCDYCSSVATPIARPVSSHGQRATAAASAAPAVVSRCSCCLPGCGFCASVAMSTERQAHLQPRKRARQTRKQGHKRPLSQELAEDSGEDSGPDSWLRVIHLPARREKHGARWREVMDASPGPWEFWELWSGCGNFTAAVMQAGGRVGPSVDILPCPVPGPAETPVPRLKLDFEDDGDVEFLWWLLHKYRPRFVHAGPPCTFWGQLGRFQAVRTQAEWAALRRQAVRHLALAVRILRWQSEHGGEGSLEQPPRCISWRLRRTEALLSQPGWRRFVWPSCAYGHRDPGNGRPYRKGQGFASNVDLTAMQAKCSCEPHSHQIVQGTVEEGDRAGERRAVVSGEYPPAMCSKLAGIILRRGGSPGLVAGP